MQFPDIAIPAAIILGPVLSVQIGQWLDRRRAVQQRRRDLFRQLMCTRTNHDDPQHVDAVNLVDVEYHGDTRVIEAWRCYMKHLMEPGAPQPQWCSRRDELLYDLLEAMARSLRYQQYDRESLRTMISRPASWQKKDQDEALIRTGLSQVLEGSRPLSVVTTGNDRSRQTGNGDHDDLRPPAREGAHGRGEREASA